MTTTISITGQISGNSILAGAINTYDSEMRRTSFNGYLITFKTKKEAKKALWEAYNYLRKDEPDFAKGGGIRYSKYGALSYDASRAQINDNQ